MITFCGFQKRHYRLVIVGRFLEFHAAISNGASQPFTDYQSSRNPGGFVFLPLSINSILINDLFLSAEE